MGDIFDSVTKSKLNYDYVVYTNADIILHEDFYNIVSEQIAKGYDAFTINRQSVFDTKMNLREKVPVSKRNQRKKVQGTKNSKPLNSYTASDLDEIFALPAEDHPGHDCFVVKKDVFEQMDLGDIYISTAVFAFTLLVEIMHYA